MKSITERVLIMAGFIVILFMACHKNPAESTINYDGTVLVKGYVYNLNNQPLNNILVNAVIQGHTLLDTTDSIGMYKYRLMPDDNITITINDTCSFYYENYNYNFSPPLVEQNSLCYYPQTINLNVQRDTTITTTLQSVNYYPVVIGKKVHYKRTDLLVSPTEMNGTTTYLDIIKECTAIDENTITYKIVEDGIKITEKVDTTSVHLEYDLIETVAPDGKININLPLPYANLYNRSIYPNLKNVLTDLVNNDKRGEYARNFNYYKELHNSEKLRAVYLYIDTPVPFVNITFVENIGITHFYYNQVTNTCFVTDLQLIEQDDFFSDNMFGK